MSDTTAFLNLVRGSRIKNYMGLITPAEPYVFGPGYLYIEIPAVGFNTGHPSELVDTVKRNQRVFVTPDCTIDPRGGYVVDVEPCISLSEFGQVQASYRVHPGTGKMVPGFWFTAHKDTQLTDLPHAVRLYMYR